MARVRGPGSYSTSAEATVYEVMLEEPNCVQGKIEEIEKIISNHEAYASKQPETHKMNY